MSRIDTPELEGPPWCGVIGCLAPADVVIDHPDHGERAVCGEHAADFEVVERV